MSVLFTRRGAAPIIGKQASDYAVGESVFLPVNGVNTEFLVVHQGLPSSNYDNNCNGTWLLMKNIYEEKVWDSSDNDYENSDIHSYLNSTFLNLFNNNIKNAIKQIKLPYWKGKGARGSYQTGSNGLSTKIFLLSDMEVGITSDDGVGAKLSYFDSGTDTTANNKRIANYNGTAISFWWLRSPSTTSNISVDGLSTNGYPSTRNSNSSYGVRPALVLDSSTKFDPDTNVIL